MKNDTNIKLLKVRKLPVIKDMDSMSNIMGFSKQLLYYYAVCKDTDKYKICQITKNNGTMRTIYAPKYALKMMQRWVLEEILYKIPCSESALAFIKSKGSPLKKNAEYHCEKIFLFKIDFHDFFPSITRQKVLNLFSDIGYNFSVSNWLTNICTFDEILPQGSVTAPYLSNLVCESLDYRILKYCSKRDIVYTRYADDLTFSSDNKVKLKKIYCVIKTIAESEGFFLNENKTRFVGKNSAKKVTGITLTKLGVKAPKEYKKLVRTMIHRAVISGDYSETSRIKGYIAYISSIENNYLEKVKNYISKLNRSNITFIDSTVEKFNANKFFHDCHDFNKIEMDINDEFADLIEERIDFLKLRNLHIPEDINIDQLSPSELNEVPF